MTRWIHGISRPLLRAAFEEYFGVATEHADVLIVLYGRPGEWTPLKRLQVLLDSHRPPKRQAVYERISALREAMEPESIVSGGQLNEFGEGYALSEVGFAECALALRALVDVLLRAGPRLSIPGATETDGPISAMGEAELAEALQQLQTSRPRPLEHVELAEGAGHRLISLEEFARRSRYSPGYIRRMSKEGRAPRAVRAGRGIAYLEKEVDEWLASLPRADDGAPLRTEPQAAE